MSILNKITPGKWYTNGNAIWQSDTRNSVALVTLQKPNISPGSEAFETAKAISKVPEMLSIIERLAKWLTEENEPNGNAVIHIAEEAETLLTELNK